jgi:hypothetical protein
MFKPDSPFQIISLFGIIFSIAAQIALYIFDKQVENMWFLYPTWVVIYILAGIFKKYFRHDHHD